ncbi:MAG: hypothetical protein JSS12_08370 [Verrucomicrobia bacterium]|nr:hypothetical protein [Verrucomicrobiota bacterium]
MDYIDEWHSLVRDLKLYIAQNYTLQPTQPEPVKVKAAAPLHAPIHAAPPASQPIVPKPPVAVKKATSPPPPPAPAPLPAIPKAPIEPLIQAMPRPFTMPAPITLGDCLAKLQNLGVPTIDAPTFEAIPQLAECVMVSFYAPSSEQEIFIKKVAASVTERLLPCRLYLQPGLQAAAECFTLAASARAKAFVMVYNQEDAPKLAQWLSYFGDDVKEGYAEQQQLTSKRTLFGVNLYELIGLKPDDPQFKRALWSDLQKII